MSTMDLDHIKASFDSPLCGLGKLDYKTLDLFYGELLYGREILSVGDSAGTNNV